MNITPDFLLDKIKEADAVLIGAGSGLSAASGLLYADLATFRAWFPGYHEKYGLSGIYEAAFFPFPSREEYYAYWARHIQKIRLDYPAGQPYRNLLQLVKNTAWFVLTTNVDGQFVKAGFASERVFGTQGDYAFFQCAKPCTQDIYPNQALVSAMLAGLTPTDFAIRSEDIPRCPRCGSFMEPNLRKDDSFVEAPWMVKNADLERFVRAAEPTGRLLLLELGVGFNTPGIIRYPFEQLARQRKNTTLIRINRDDVQASLPGLDNQLFSFKGDIGEFLAAACHLAASA